MRKHPKIVYRRPSPNQSARTASIRGIVLHSTESPNRPDDADLKGIADYFANPAVDASSHVITDGDGHSARCVDDSRKAWTCVAFNSLTLNIEQIGYASQDHWSEDQLKETARWCARWSKKFDIPLQRGAVSGSSVTRMGILTHAQLGAAGGGHSDPGSAYPVGHVIDLAKHFKQKL